MSTRMLRACCRIEVYDSLSNKGSHASRETSPALWTRIMSVGILISWSMDAMKASSPSSAGGSKSMKSRALSPVCLAISQRGSLVINT